MQICEHIYGVLREHLENKTVTIQLFQVRALRSKRFSVDKRISAREICYGSCVQLTIWNKWFNYLQFVLIMLYYKYYGTEAARH
jgi:hypothetical protein